MVLRLARQSDVRVWGDDACSSSVPRFDIKLCRIKNFSLSLQATFSHLSSSLSFLFYAMYCECWMHSGFIAWCMYPGRWIQFNPKLFFVSSVQTSPCCVFRWCGAAGCLKVMFQWVSKAFKLRFFFRSMKRLAGVEYPFVTFSVHRRLQKMHQKLKSHSSTLGAWKN